MLQFITHGTMFKYSNVIQCRCVFFLDFMKAHLKKKTLAKCELFLYRNSELSKNAMYRV